MDTMPRPLTKEEIISLTVITERNATAINMSGLEVTYRVQGNFTICALFGPGITMGLGASKLSMEDVKRRGKKFRIICGNKDTGKSFSFARAVRNLLGIKEKTTRGTFKLDKSNGQTTKIETVSESR